MTSGSRTALTHKLLPLGTLQGQSSTSQTLYCCCHFLQHPRCLWKSCPTQQLFLKYCYCHLLRLPTSHIPSCTHQKYRSNLQQPVQRAAERTFLYGHVCNNRAIIPVMLAAYMVGMCQDRPAVKGLKERFQHSSQSSSKHARSAVQTKVRLAPHVSFQQPAT